MVLSVDDLTALCLYTARTVLRQCTPNSAALYYYACGPNGEDPVALPVGSACTSMSRMGRVRSAKCVDPQ